MKTLFFHHHCTIGKKTLLDQSISVGFTILIMGRNQIRPFRLVRGAVNRHMSGINQSRPGIFLKKPYLFCNFFREKEVIVIQPGNQLTRSHFHPQVAGGGHSSIFFEIVPYFPLILFYYSPCFVAGAIVHHNQLKILESLAQNTFHRFLQQPAPVVRRHYHTDERHQIIP